MRTRSRTGFGCFGISKAFFAIRRRIFPTSAHRSSFPPMAGSRDGSSTKPPVKRCGDRSVYAILPDSSGARSGRCDGCSPRPSTAPSSARNRRAHRKESCRGSGDRDCYPRFATRRHAPHLRELRAPLGPCLSRPSAFLRQCGAVEQIFEPLPVLGAMEAAVETDRAAIEVFLPRPSTGGTDWSTSIPSRMIS